MVLDGLGSNPSGAAMKICGSCSKSLELSSFSRKGDGYQSTCKSCRKEWYANYYKTSDKEKNRLRNKKRQLREEIRQIVVEAKSVPCMDCKVSYPYYVMDFDHRDPTTKKFNIADNYTHSSKKKILEEIAKCDVVCSNCHRIRTYQC